MEMSLNRLRVKRFKRILTHGWFAGWYWRKSNYSPPSPYKIKKSILLSNALRDAPWIETGTYLGETTKFLARHYPYVITFEPSKSHYFYAMDRFKKTENITVINSTSENGLNKCLSKLSGEVNIYLDGHASGDGTFTGNNRTPIRYELEIIEKNLVKFSKLFVAIDDFRVFGSSDGIYPSNYYLVNFCKKNKLKWKVEQDIFMFTTY